MNLPALRKQASRFTGLCSSAGSSRNQDQANFLPAPAAQALADLLPLLLCGEASAELVFMGAADELPEAVDPALRAALKRIAEDEIHHGRLLGALRDRLPPPSVEDGARRAAHFLRHLQCRDLGLHLARVAALDAGACLVFMELTRPGAIMSQHKELATLFSRLGEDEGRHVRVTLQCAAALGVAPARVEAERRQVWLKLAELLTPGTSALQNLGVDVRRLFERLAPARHRGLHPMLAEG